MQKGQSDNREERSLFIQEKIVLPFRYCFAIFAILPSFLFPISLHTVVETTSFRAFRLTEIHTFKSFSSVGVRGYKIMFCAI